jgi:hypothetical protein
VNKDVAAHYIAGNAVRATAARHAETAR